MPKMSAYDREYWKACNANAKLEIRHKEEQEKCLKPFFKNDFVFPSAENVIQLFFCND